MQKILINFADKYYRNSQKINSKSGLDKGGFDIVYEFSPNDIEKDFYIKNIEILKSVRGAGFWLWKPYFILRMLNEINDNDFLFYCDSGAEFINSIEPIITLTESFSQDIIPFELQFKESEYTKRDAFILMECDEQKYYDSKQRLASFILIKKSKQSRQFAEEYLKYGCDKRIIADIPNELGQENYSNFIDHRHDQSIYSLLTKKYNLKAFRDPSQWGDPFKSEYPDSKYGTIINHTRKQKKSLKKLFLKLVRTIKSS